MNSYRPAFAGNKSAAFVGTSLSSLGSLILSLYFVSRVRFWFSLHVHFTPVQCSSISPGRAPHWRALEGADHERCSNRPGYITVIPSILRSQSQGTPPGHNSGVIPGVAKVAHVLVPRPQPRYSAPGILREVSVQSTTAALPSGNSDAPRLYPSR